MEFIKKNFVTIMVVGATVVLAGVAVFTSLRLYNLRNNPVTPVRPETSTASDSPLGIRPKSGNWNLPETFVITNSSEETQEVVWHIDCWDETVCEDSQGTETLSTRQTFEEGLGNICSQWQLDLNWSGTATADNDIWDWAGVSDLGPECDFELLVDEEEVFDTDEAIILDEPKGDASEFEVTMCTALTFTIGDEPVASTIPIVTVTPTATIAPQASATVTSTPRPVSTATTAPQLPDAGVGLPTIMGMSIGAIMLIIAVTLAL